VRTMEGPPKKLGVTHWSSRLLAAELGISNVAVANIWREHDLQPWRIGTFKFSTDPQLDAKVCDVVGLYLAPPAKAVVVCVDEKSQIQALDRTAPMLPLAPGLPARRTHDYKRHGTTTLFAALEVATGRITADACYPRHRHQEFLAFLEQVAKAHPRVKLHVVCDNYSTHKTDEVNAWLARHPRVTLHFTPTSGSWLNMVEIFFGIITRQAIRRGTFRSVHELTDAIRRFIDAYNQRAKPFTWVKTADQILARAKPAHSNPLNERFTRALEIPEAARRRRACSLYEKRSRCQANHAAATRASSCGERSPAGSPIPAGPPVPIPASSARTPSSQFNRPGLHPPRIPASSKSRRNVAPTDPSTTKSQDTSSHKTPSSSCSQ
jgi:transposase